MSLTRDRVGTHDDRDGSATLDEQHGPHELDRRRVKTGVGS
jgi:hypothetical protein